MTRTLSRFILSRHRHRHGQHGQQEQHGVVLHATRRSSTAQQHGAVRTARAAALYVQQRSTRGIAEHTAWRGTLSCAHLNLCLSRARGWAGPAGRRGASHVQCARCATHCLLSLTTTLCACAVCGFALACTSARTCAALQAHVRTVLRRRICTDMPRSARRQHHGPGHVILLASHPSPRSAANDGAAPETASTVGQRAAQLRWCPLTRALSPARTSPPLAVSTAGPRCAPRRWVRAASLPHRWLVRALPAARAARPQTQSWRVRDAPACCSTPVLVAS